MMSMNLWKHNFSFFLKYENFSSSVDRELYFNIERVVWHICVTSFRFLWGDRFDHLTKKNLRYENFINPRLILVSKAVLLDKLNKFWTF